MILTRTDTSATLELPDDYYWEDEHASLVAQSVDTGLTGSAIIQEATRLYREMTLRPWSTEASWIPRATLDTLRDWADVPGLILTLARLGQSYTLRWRYDGGAIDREPVVYWINDTADPTAEPQYRATLRFWVLG